MLKYTVLTFQVVFFSVRGIKSTIPYEWASADSADSAVDRHGASYPKGVFAFSAFWAHTAAGGASHADIASLVQIAERDVTVDIDVWIVAEKLERTNTDVEWAGIVCVDSGKWVHCTTGLKKKKTERKRRKLDRIIVWRRTPTIRRSRFLFNFLSFGWNELTNISRRT